MRMKIDKATATRLLQELSKDYEVKIYFSNTSFIDGCARYWNNSISVSLRQTPVGMLSTFFHEIGHLHCWENKLWRSYHVTKPLKLLTSEEKKKYIRTALKSERWVDNWAKKEMRKHFPNLSYIESYDDHTGEIFLKQIKKKLNVQ